MINHMNVNELKDKMDSQDDIILIDCRENDEWNEGHIKGAKLMPLSIFLDQKSNLIDKNKTVIIQCRSGNRSMLACQYLLTDGFTDVYNLTGGINDWISHGFPIEQ